MGPYVKWGSSTSPLIRAVGSAAGNGPFAVTAFNASYTDSGLFGFISSSPGNVAGLVRFTILFNNVASASSWIMFVHRYQVIVSFELAVQVLVSSMSQRARLYAATFKILLKSFIYYVSPFLF